MEGKGDKIEEEIYKSTQRVYNKLTVHSGTREYFEQLFNECWRFIMQGFVRMSQVFCIKQR